MLRQDAHHDGTNGNLPKPATSRSLAINAVQIAGILAIPEVSPGRARAIRRLLLPKRRCHQSNPHDHVPQVAETLLANASEPGS